MKKQTLEQKILHKAADFYSKNRNNRDTLKKVRLLTYKLRTFRIPLYKNIFDVIHFRSYFVVLERLIAWKKPRVTFEWGPGLNTEMFALAGALAYSVEHDKSWLSVYDKKKPAGSTLIFSPLREDSYLEYPLEIKKIKEPVDMAFVDGRCRVQCIASCKEKNVPVVVMHDSLHYVTMKTTVDGTPPISNEGQYNKEGYKYYQYFIEIVDLRTIILVDIESDFKQILSLYTDLYTTSGKTSDYEKMSRNV